MRKNNMFYALLAVSICVFNNVSAGRRTKEIDELNRRIKDVSKKLDEKENSAHKENLRTVRRLARLKKGMGFLVKEALKSKNPKERKKESALIRKLGISLSDSSSSYSDSSSSYSSSSYSDSSSSYSS